MLLGLYSQPTSRTFRKQISLATTKFEAISTAIEAQSLRFQECSESLPKAHASEIANKARLSWDDYCVILHLHHANKKNEFLISATLSVGYFTSPRVTK